MIEDLKFETGNQFWGVSPNLIAFMFYLLKLFSFQVYNLIMWTNALTVACHNGKMYTRRQREWRVTECPENLDFAAVKKFQ